MNESGDKVTQKWTIEEASENPFHFKRFLTPAAREKFDAMFTGRNSRGLQSHGKNMKQLYYVSLSAVELDKFEAASNYPDLQVMTVFLGDDNLDRAYFKPRALQMKQNII